MNRISGLRSYRTLSFLFTVLEKSWKIRYRFYGGNRLFIVVGWATKGRTEPDELSLPYLDVAPAVGADVPVYTVHKVDLK